MKAFMVYTLLFGYALPTHDEYKFDTKSACQLYLHVNYTQSVVDTFKLYCEDVSPPMCQGKVCE
jgi:hypothetical protein